MYRFVLAALQVGRTTAHTVVTDRGVFEIRSVLLASMSLCNADCALLVVNIVCQNLIQWQQVQVQTRRCVVCVAVMDYGWLVVVG